MATKIPAPKVRKAKSSSAEAFRKFLSKRVDIVEEGDEEADTEPVAKVEKAKKPEKPEKPEKVGGPNPADLQRMYSDLLSDLLKNAKQPRDSIPAASPPKTESEGTAGSRQRSAADPLIVA